MCNKVGWHACDTNGERLGSYCEFKNHMCRTAVSGVGVSLAHFGHCVKKDCKAECPKEKGLVCDTQGQTHWNNCYFAIAACKARKKGQVIRTLKAGPCEEKEGNPENCCKGNCALYRGRQTTTVSGEMCHPWRDLPADHHNHPDKNPNAGLNLNYCRNPSGRKNAGCYIKNRSGKPVWKNCNVPKCLKRNKTPTAPPKQCHSVWSGWSCFWG